MRRPTPTGSKLPSSRATRCTTVPGTPPAEPFTVDETFKDGDPIDAAGGLIAYHTPGHTPGHTSYYQPERKLLFSGDLFFGAEEEKVLLTLPEFTHHSPTALISARRMNQLSVDSLLTYHGGPVLKNGGKAMRAFTRKIQEGYRPTPQRDHRPWCAGGNGTGQI